MGYPFKLNYKLSFKQPKRQRKSLTSLTAKNLRKKDKNPAPKINLARSLFPIKHSSQN